MPTLAEILSDATIRDRASKRGRDWLSSIPQSVQPAGPPDRDVPGSARYDYNQSFGDLVGSQIVMPDSGLGAFSGGPGHVPSAEQQRQWLAQLEMHKELGRLNAERRLAEWDNAHAPLPPMASWK